MTEADDNTTAEPLPPRDAFLKAHGVNWNGFCAAYATPPVKKKPAKKKKGGPSEDNLPADDYRMLVDTVMCDSGKVYRPANHVSDTELLLDLAFGPETYSEFQAKHAHENNLRIRLENAATCFSHYVVMDNKELRKQRVPMLHAVEDALVAKWVSMRDEKVMAHRFMEGHPLSDAVGDRLKGDRQFIMRKEIVAQPDAAFAHTILLNIFSTKCRTSMYKNIPKLHECFRQEKIKPNDDEAAYYLLRAYHEHFDGALFTYDPNYQKKVDDPEAPRPATFSTKLAGNINAGHVLNAATFFRYDNGYTCNPSSEHNNLLRRTIYLDVRCPAHGDSRREMTFAERLGLAAPDKTPEATTEHLLDAIEHLPQKDRELISNRFGLGGQDSLTRKELADLQSVSTYVIDKRQSNIIKKLARQLGVSDDDVSDTPSLGR